jgi:hypothetical protein
MVFQVVILRLWCSEKLAVIGQILDQKALL